MQEQGLKQMHFLEVSEDGITLLSQKTISNPKEHGYLHHQKAPKSLRYKARVDVGEEFFCLAPLPSL